MISMHMGDEYSGDLLPAEIQHLHRDLRPLSRIEEEQITIAADKYRCKKTPRKRHHTAGTELESFKVHDEILSGYSLVCNMPHEDSSNDTVLFYRSRFLVKMLW